MQSCWMWPLSAALKQRTASTALTKPAQLCTSSPTTGRLAVCPCSGTLLCMVYLCSNNARGWPEVSDWQILHRSKSCVSPPAGQSKQCSRDEDERVAARSMLADASLSAFGIFKPCSSHCHHHSLFISCQQTCVICHTI